MGVSAVHEESRRRWEPLDVEAAAVATSLAVMAPALTEGGPQKPENLITPLPSSGFLSPSQASQVCQNRQVLAKFVVSANVQPSKIDEQCLRGISKEFIRDVINSRYANGLDTLPAFKTKPNLISRKALSNDTVLCQSEQTVGFDSLNQEATDIIMNDPSMGDQQDNMGFLKSNIDVPLASNENLNDKNLDVDQIINFSSVMPSENEQCSSSSVGDIGQNVEDILQVIKSMEGAENAENIPGGSNYHPRSVTDSVEMFPIPEGFSSFERDLLNDVDVMSLCNENMNIDAVEQQKFNNLRTQQDAVTQKQHESERRCAFLLRRLRKLQARIIGRHVAEENTGVLEVAHHGVKKYFIQELVNISSKSSVRNFPEISSSLNSFLQKLEKTSVAQSNGINRQRVCCRYFGGGSRDNFGPSPSSTTNRHPVFGTPQVKIQRNDVESVAGPLTSQLRTVETNLDSDCTASSSGGESCDEMQTFNNPHQQPLPISKRAAWRYAQDRAGVASRWTWLQAQISDLEYRIRQHNDLQRQIRATKGLVILENTETVNGYSGVLPGSTGRCGVLDTEPAASRTRPFMWNAYRKRKLLQVDRLHEVSKRAAKASTVRCGCDHVLPACALCTGRQDPTQPQEPFEQLSVQQRVALIDSGFHPVLSFSDEILHSTHLEAIMKSVEWQQKMLRGNMRTTRLKDKEHNERRNKKLPEHRAKYTARLKKSSSSILTANHFISGIKRKMLKGKRNRLSHDRGIHGLTRKKVTKLPLAQDEDDVPHSGSSKHSSPVPSPLQHTVTAEKNPPKEKSSSTHGRLRQNSYDIDNIVIPYSVAAATRLEKLQYKEILTPKWRLCEDPSKVDVKNGIMHRPSQESDVEDVTDETIALRHERSEREENKRFMTYVNMPPQARLRHTRRADSRADSGANTPDPMSPQPSEFGGDVVSPITSPPATPLMPQDSENQQQQLLDMHRPSALQNSFRRRTISSSRPSRDETVGSLPEDDNEVIPYEPRTFPLSEDTYDRMIEAMPDGHWQASSASLCSRDEEKGEEEPEIETPESDSTESACCDVEGEDPNDPEWTVADDRDTEKERIRPTAKR
ncbi:KAT8 regulatory NSL complex subunit 1 isoform X2 [Neodiprion fabricii]|uniref:KAT8 regulatory NSL complex subunit 1 isoform X2 n=1 Tax=Neodiprion fabricii TaxID=2872261 RepID=UPI001ED8FB20|nr:KAT8 regulatory NSL complex subunit 1 isoform X2 [Neodiprion fabricii]